MSEQERKYTPVDPTAAREQFAEMPVEEFAGIQAIFNEEARRRIPSAPAKPASEMGDQEFRRYSEDLLRRADRDRQAERERLIAEHLAAQRSLGAR